MTEPPFADVELERLVTTAALGDEDGWRDLWSHVEPRLAAVLRRRTFIRRAARPDDDARDVIVAVMARLRDQGFHRLKLYLAARRADPTLTFMRWLIVVAKRVAIDVMRAHPDYVDRRRAAPREGSRSGTWIVSDKLPADEALSAGRPPMTNRVAARQILRYAAGVLPEPQRRALAMWVENHGADEIAGALALSGPGEAERVVHAALERLRRHFRRGPER